MRHLKLNESIEDDLKSYFKDKINWKFFNYLKDKCTELEDTGIRFQVIVASHEDVYNTGMYKGKVGWCEIYKYFTLKQDHYDDDDFNDAQTAVNMYKEHGLIYVVVMHNNKYENREKYVDSISARAIEIELPLMSRIDRYVYIIVMPK